MIRPAREIDEHTPWQEMTLGERSMNRPPPGM